MSPSTSMISHKGPTVATLKAIEDVLRREAMPMTRYKIRQALGYRIGQPLLDEGFEYMAEHEMIYDEGPGGQVFWLLTSAATRARLRIKLAFCVVNPKLLGVSYAAEAVLFLEVWRRLAM